jgi:large subunit ribosomal protein L25
METVTITAEPRSQVGTRAARQARAAGRIPVNIYGHGEANVLASLDAREFTRFLAAGHRIATLKVGGKEEPGVVKEVQYDSLGTTIIHVDFTRIRKDEKIQVEVPVELFGVPKGVTSGGVLAFPMKEVLVSGFPMDIPEHILVNVEKLEIGQALRIKDLPVPANCQFEADAEAVVLSVVHQKVEAAPVPVEGAAVQPEVIGKKKEEEGAEGEAAPEEPKKKEGKEGKDKEK